MAVAIGFGGTTRLRRLWRGELPLVRAFWDWAILGGLVVNLSTTLGFVLLLEQGQTLAAFAVGYACSVPYNFLAALAVWRAAARYQGHRLWPLLARAIALPLLFGLSFV
jgi:hypothetical protein